MSRKGGWWELPWPEGSTAQAWLPVSSPKTARRTVRVVMAHKVADCRCYLKDGESTDSSRKSHENIAPEKSFQIFELHLELT